MKSKRLAFVDLETTGANPAVDRITEIGIVTVDGEKVSHWNSLVDPGCRIPPYIQTLTGITTRPIEPADSYQDHKPAAVPSVCRGTSTTANLYLLIGICKDRTTFSAASDDDVRVGMPDRSTLSPCQSL